MPCQRGQCVDDGEGQHDADASEHKDPDDPSRHAEGLDRCGDVRLQRIDCGAGWLQITYSGSGRKTRTLRGVIVTGSPGCSARSRAVSAGRST